MVLPVCSHAGSLLCYEGPMSETQTTFLVAFKRETIDRNQSWDHLLPQQPRGFCVPTERTGSYIGTAPTAPRPGDVRGAMSPQTAGCPLLRRTHRHPQTWRFPTKNLGKPAGRYVRSPQCPRCLGGSNPIWAENSRPVCPRRHQETV